MNPGRIWQNRTVVKGREYVYWEFLDPDTRLRVKFRSRKQAVEEKAKRHRLYWGRGLERYGHEAEDVLFHEHTALELGLTPRQLTERARAAIQAELETRNSKPGTVALSTAEAVERFLLAKQLHCRERTVSDLRSRLRRWARDNPGPIWEHRAETLQRWALTRAGVRARTRNNDLAAVQNLFANFDELADHPQSRAIARLKPIEAEPARKHLWTPAELLEILVAAQRHDHALIPVIVLGAFAGLRTSEALRLHVADFRPEKSRDKTKVIIESSKTKVKRTRTVGFPDNLVDWLRSYLPKYGPLWSGHENTLHVRLRKLCARASLPWRANALRKSWSTYQDLRSHNLALQSRHAGNSPSMQQAHYLNPRDAADGAAEAWFNLRPGDGIQGVLPFPAIPTNSQPHPPLRVSQ